MIWYPARVLPPVGIVAGLILACAHGRGAGESAAVQRPAPPPPSPSTVTSDEIARQPVVSLDQLLAGRIAGVTVTPARGGGKIWIRMFPDKPVTKKPAETRMGKGKGAPEYWVAVVKPGRILYEIEGVDEKTARDAMKLAAQKLPIRTKFVTRAEQEGGAI